MDIGIIGSGQVAQTLGGKLLDLGHSVTISSRDPDRPKHRLYPLARVSLPLLTSTTLTFHD